MEMGYKRILEQHLLPDPKIKLQLIGMGDNTTCTWHGTPNVRVRTEIIRRIEVHVDEDDEYNSDGCTTQIYNHLNCPNQTNYCVTNTTTCTLGPYTSTHTM